MKAPFTALLPMKGHSERVPGKNLRPFDGRPLYHRVMETLAACPGIGHIVVDTDSREIRRAVECDFPKARVIDRPRMLCGDFVPMNRVIEHDLTQTGGELYVQTHSTNPLLTAQTLQAALDLFTKAEGFDSVFSVTRRQARFYDAQGCPVNHSPNELLRTQDLHPLYEENSCFYVFSRDSFGKTFRRIGLKPRLFEIPRIEGIDIDEEEDFLLAEAIWRQQRMKVSKPAGPHASSLK